MEAIFGNSHIMASNGYWLSAMSPERSIMSYRPYATSLGFDADERQSLSDSIPLATYTYSIQKNACTEPLDLMLFTYPILIDKRM